MAEQPGGKVVNQIQKNTTEDLGVGEVVPK